MKQKVTSIFLLATLVLSLLVGCSTDEGNSSNYPVESPSSVSSGIVGSPQSTDNLLYVADGKRQYTLCHYPMMSWPHIMRCYMVFGHIHGNTDADYWPLIQANERMLNAGVDVNHFEPVTFEEMEANNLLYKGQSKAWLEVQP